MYGISVVRNKQANSSTYCWLNLLQSFSQSTIFVCQSLDLLPGYKVQT